MHANDLQIGPFKTGRPWQPQGWKVRFLRRSVGRLGRSLWRRWCLTAVPAEHLSRTSHVAICESAPWRVSVLCDLDGAPLGEYVRLGRLPIRALLHVSLLKGAVATPEGGARRRLVGLVALLIAAALAVTGLVGASAASAAAAGGGRGPISVLAPRAGAVIVARTRAGAKRLRVGATLLVTRPVGGLSARLNGHPVRLPAIRSGRLAVRLGAANGLAVGENVLQVSAGRSGGRPRWVVPARFFVGYRDARILASGSGRPWARSSRRRARSCGCRGSASGA